MFQEEKVFCIEVRIVGFGRGWERKRIIGAEVTELGQPRNYIGRTLEFDLDFISHIEFLAHLES